VACGEVRHAQGAFYRCRGGGRRPGDGEVKAAPLMVLHVGYRKRGRRMRQKRRGKGKGHGGSASRHGTGDRRRGAEDGDTRPACLREENEGGGRTSVREEREGWVGRPKATGSARGRREVGRGWVENRRWAKVQKEFLFESQLILEFGRTLENSTRRFRKKFDMGIFHKIF
jgi:hypothetical protein